MREKKRFLVVGLGVLGRSIALSLTKEGAEVMVLDRSPTLIDEIHEYVGVAVVGDATDRKTLEQIGARDVDAAIVCIGENFESAVLSVAHLIDLKVKSVAVRANNELGESILKRLGADEVFFVEHAMGELIAHKLMHRKLEREMDLGDGYRVVQVKALPLMYGKSLAELALPKAFNVQVIAVRGAKSEGGMTRPEADTVIHAGDTLLLSGHGSALQRLLSEQR